MGVLEVIILAMMYVICFSVFFQKSPQRTIVAATFAIAIVLHDRLFHAMSDDSYLYYLTAAIFDLLVILIVSKITDRPRLASDIQVISLVSIVFNLIGWVQYVNGYEGDMYMLMYVALYGWAIVALCRREPIDAGNTEDSSVGDPVRTNASAGHIFHHTGPAKK